MKAVLSAAEVRGLFDYEDGKLIWREDRGLHRTAHTIAGYHRDCLDNPAHIISVDKRKHTRARLVWAWHHGQWPSGVLWHRNSNSVDDRIENLLNLTPREFCCARRHGEASLGTGGSEMSFSGEATTAPPQNYFSAVGKSAANIPEVMNHDAL